MIDPAAYDMRREDRAVWCDGEVWTTSVRCIVALTPRGKSVITPIYRAHVETMEKVFAGLSRDDLRQLEQQLKRVGKQAESLFDRSVAKGRTAK